MSESFSLPAFTMADYNLYRVDDRIFYVFVIAALAFCLIHAAFRAFRQPQPTEVHGIHPAGDEELQRHTLFQLIYHWANSVAIFTLLISGWMMYQPRQIPNLEGSTSEWFFWHRWGIALLLVAILAHIVREVFVAKEANPMVFDRAEVKRLLSIFKDFFGFFKKYHLPGKYHTGQIFFHWAVAGNILVLILTGMVLWKPFRDFLPLSLFGLGWDFIYFSRVIHGFFSATLIASLIGHLYFALLIKKNWPETKSMFTGRMSLREYLESHSPLE
ncbi:MAG: cytochrome b/b6 domain-containing protein [Thermodesulfobacteriota bacterium]|jgi:cytochrome b subunit of formate dehydrogenase